MHNRRQPQGQPSPKRNKQKHLYLVLDDWDKGYTIRKIDASGPHLGHPSPPLLRLASPAPSCPMYFTSMGGSHILAVSNRHPATLVYDTDTEALAAGPSLPDALLGGYDIFVPTADTLCAFGHPDRERPQSVEVMSSASADKHHLHSSSSLIPSKDWSWRSVVPSPFTEDERIRSYSVHPDGCTVFVSSRFSRTRDDNPSRTFSFNISNCEWRCHGDWELPFHGQGYFDSDLDAWVGLHPDGYIGTCQVASRSSTATTAAQLDWKMADEKLWSEEEQPAGGPTLTCMGNARFCLVETVVGNELHGGVSMLLVTTFRLRYSRNGELQLIDRDTESCSVPKHNSNFSPIAFWM